MPCPDNSSVKFYTDGINGLLNNPRIPGEGGGTAQDSNWYYVATIGPSGGSPLVTRISRYGWSVVDSIYLDSDVKYIRQITLDPENPGFVYAVAEDISGHSRVYKINTGTGTVDTRLYLDDFGTDNAIQIGNTLFIAPVTDYLFNDYVHNVIVAIDLVSMTVLNRTSYVVQSYVDFDYTANMVFDPIAHKLYVNHSLQNSTPTHDDDAAFASFDVPDVPSPTVITPSAAFLFFHDASLQLWGWNLNNLWARRTLSVPEGGTRLVKMDRNFEILAEQSYPLGTIQAFATRNLSYTHPRIVIGFPGRISIVEANDLTDYFSVNVDTMVGVHMANIYSILQGIDGVINLNGQDLSNSIGNVAQVCSLF